MLWLLLGAAVLILSRTYLWAILLWGYGRAGLPEDWESVEPVPVRPAAPEPSHLLCGDPPRPAPRLCLPPSRSPAFPEAFTPQYGPPKGAASPPSWGEDWPLRVSALSCPKVPGFG